jgi:hypothetical protein
VLARSTNLGGEVGAALAGQGSAACELNERAVDGHQRFGDDARLDVVGGGSGLSASRSAGESA